ncbi:MAG: hypothetical protein HPY50_13630 [Firmicutes bacterium]|nr:hypothetical protein [Bacillota bacterium]
MSSGEFDSLAVKGNAQLKSLTVGCAGTPRGTAGPEPAREECISIDQNSIQAKETKWGPAQNPTAEWISEGQSQSRLSIQPEGGDVSFGEASKVCQVDISGDLKVNGSVEVTGDIYLKNADLAELFDISGADAVEPGTVMVLDENGGLRASTTAYDKRVAGIISGAGEYRPGIVLDKQESQNRCRPITLSGKAYCKVDAELEPIEVGDLLTTSPTAGYAMKAVDPARAFGAVIGKAMRPLAGGRDLIPVLVALQ